MTAIAMTSPNPLPEPRTQVLGPSSVARTVTIKPAMCGHNSLFVGQVGDWTWDTVSALCNTNVFTARNASGMSTYLAFFYYHIKASPSLHLSRITFGDQLEIGSQCFNFGSESILTLHRIEKSEGGRLATAPIDLEEFYERPKEGCIYVENFNRWLTRSEAKSNEGLVMSAPEGFRSDHLPTLPARYSPRLAYDYARRSHTFLTPSVREGMKPLGELNVEYRVDITRDVNGVGLLYFASYFSIIDHSLLRLWRELGRSDESFMDRIVTDHKICYLGNANIHSVLTIKTTLSRAASQPDTDLFNFIIQDCRTERVIAVSTVHIQTP